MSTRTARTAPPAPDGYRAVGPDEWRQTWKRVRVSASVKAIGYTLAEAADWRTGASIFLGNRKIALASGEQSTRSVIRALAQMRELGLIWRYFEGGSRGGLSGSADEYRLTIPDDIAARVPMLTARLDLPDGDHVTSGHLVTDDHLVTGSQGPCDSDDAGHVTVSHPISTVTPTSTSTADASRLAEDQTQGQSQTEGQDPGGLPPDPRGHPPTSGDRDIETTGEAAAPVKEGSATNSQNRGVRHGSETVADDAPGISPNDAESATTGTTRARPRRPAKSAALPPDHLRG